MLSQKIKSHLSCPQLQRSWRGILFLSCCSIHTFICPLIRLFLCARYLDNYFSWDFETWWAHLDWSIDHQMNFWEKRNQNNFCERYIPFNFVILQGQAYRLRVSYNALECNTNLLWINYDCLESGVHGKNIEQLKNKLSRIPDCSRIARTKSIYESVKSFMNWLWFNYES